VEKVLRKHWSTGSKRDYVMSRIKLIKLGQHLSQKTEFKLGHRPSEKCLEKNHNRTGEKHPRWNKELREFLVKEQGKHFCQCGCGQPIIIKRHHYYMGISRLIAGHHQRGKFGSNWKGGISTLQRGIRGLQKYIDWRTTVFERDNYVCTICGKIGGKLQVHHCLPFARLLKLYNIDSLAMADKTMELWNPELGITLCKEHHNEIKHSGNGR
jgi:hypothetical protein